LQNLISNALRHTKSRKITVSKQNEDKDKLIIEVIDNGIGMSKEITKNLLPHKWSLFKKQELKIKEPESGYY
jgi:signal transduction histidine kinase